MENDIETKKQFAGMMYGIAGNFGGNINKHDLKLRFKLLQDFSMEEITKAGVWLLKHREKTFPAVPTVKEFLDTLQAISNPIMSLKVQAGLQCDIVLKYFGRDGSNCQHIFKHPSTRYLMTHRWGFPYIGRTKQTELNWFRKEFVEAWVGMEEAIDHVGKSIEYTGDDKIPIENLQKLITKKED